MAKNHRGRHRQEREPPPQPGRGAAQPEREQPPPGRDIRAEQADITTPPQTTGTRTDGNTNSRSGRRRRQKKTRAPDPIVLSDGEEEATGGNAELITPAPLTGRGSAATSSMGSDVEQVQRMEEVRQRAARAAQHFDGGAAEEVVAEDEGGTTAAGKAEAVRILQCASPQGRPPTAHLVPDDTIVTVNSSLPEGDTVVTVASSVPVILLPSTQDGIGEEDMEEEKEDEREGPEVPRDERGEDAGSDEDMGVPPPEEAYADLEPPSPPTQEEEKEVVRSHHYADLEDPNISSAESATSRNGMHLDIVDQLLDDDGFQQPRTKSQKRKQKRNRNAAGQAPGEENERSTITSRGNDSLSQVRTHLQYCVARTLYPRQCGAGNAAQARLIHGIVSTLLGQVQDHGEALMEMTAGRASSSAGREQPSPEWVDAVQAARAVWEADNQHVEITSPPSAITIHGDPETHDLATPEPDGPERGFADMAMQIVGKVDGLREMVDKAMLFLQTPEPLSTLTDGMEQLQATQGILPQIQKKIIYGTDLIEHYLLQHSQDTAERRVVLTARDNLRALSGRVEQAMGQADHLYKHLRATMTESIGTEDACPVCAATTTDPRAVHVRGAYALMGCECCAGKCGKCGGGSGGFLGTPTEQTAMGLRSIRDALTEMAGHTRKMRIQEVTPEAANWRLKIEDLARRLRWERMSLQRSPAEAVSTDLQQEWLAVTAQLRQVVEEITPWELDAQIWSTTMLAELNDTTMKRNLLTDLAGAGDQEAAPTIPATMPFVRNEESGIYTGTRVWAVKNFERDCHPQGEGQQLEGVPMNWQQRIKKNQALYLIGAAEEGPNPRKFLAVKDSHREGAVFEVDIMEITTEEVRSKHEVTARGASKRGQSTSPADSAASAGAGTCTARTCHMCDAVPSGNPAQTNLEQFGLKPLKWEFAQLPQSLLTLSGSMPLTLSLYAGLPLTGREQGLEEVPYVIWQCLQTLNQREWPGYATEAGSERYQQIQQEVQKEDWDLQRWHGVANELLAQVMSPTSPGVTVPYPSNHQPDTGTQECPPTEPDDVSMESASLPVADGPAVSRHPEVGAGPASKEGGAGTEDAPRTPVQVGAASQRSGEGVGKPEWRGWQTHNRADAANFNVAPMQDEQMHEFPALMALSREGMHECPLHKRDKNGKLAGGKCLFRTTHADGFLQHISKMHKGEKVTEELAQIFYATGHRACDHCDVIRKNTRPACPNCTRCWSVHDIEPGDIIPRLGGAVVRGESTGDDSDLVESATSGAEDRGFDLAEERRQRMERKQQRDGTQTIVYGAPEGGQADQTRKMEEICQKWEEKERQQQARLARDVRADGEARASQQAKATRIVPRNIGRLPRSFFDSCDKLKGNTLEQIPAASINNYTKLRTETLEGCLASGSLAEWGRMSMALPKLILGPVPMYYDMASEIRSRLRYALDGHWEALLLHVEMQQKQGPPTDREVRTLDEELAADGKRARKLCMAGAASKALKSLSGGMADGPAEVRDVWARRLIPQDMRKENAQTRRTIRPMEDEMLKVKKNGWGEGDEKAARVAMEEANRQQSPKTVGLPTVRMNPNTAPGVSGERVAHWQACLNAPDQATRQRFRRVVDRITVLYATGQLPDSFQWLYNTKVIFLDKATQQKNEAFEAEDWIVSDGIRVPKQLTGQVNGAAGQLSPQEKEALQRKKVRPIQMGEVMMKWLSKRCLKADQAMRDRVMLQARQYGCGIEGGAEAIQVFMQTLHDLWETGDLTVPLVRIKIDESNFFGNCYWDAMRKQVAQNLPNMAPRVYAKHDQGGKVYQDGCIPLSKTRGAEQGHPDAPAESSMALTVVGRGARKEVHAMQVEGKLPWMAYALPHPPDPHDPIQVRTGLPPPEQLGMKDYQERQERTEEWGKLPEAQKVTASGQRLTHPQDEIQEQGGVLDLWFMDDADIMCHPTLALDYMRAFDRYNQVIGGERNLDKSEAVYYTTWDAYQAQGDFHNGTFHKWHIDEMRRVATVYHASEIGTKEKAKLVTLGVACGSGKYRVKEFNERATTLTHMDKKLRVIEDTQIELTLARTALGVAKVNHLQRINGDVYLEDQDCLKRMDRVQMDMLKRVVPNMDEDSVYQATLGQSLGGLGWRLASDVALGAALAGHITALPKVRIMAWDMQRAGLLNAGVITEHLERRISGMQEKFEASLQEPDRGRGHAYIEKAKQRAEDAWKKIRKGDLSPEPRALRVQYLDLVEDKERKDLLTQDIDDAREKGQELDGLIAQAEDETRGGAQRVQQELNGLVDGKRLPDLLKNLKRRGKYAQLRRLKQLANRYTSHQWIYNNDPQKGTVLCEEDYLINMQKRLGAPLLETSLKCSKCRGVVDTEGWHCETCGCSPAATKGHYGVVGAFVDLFRCSDAGTEVEVSNLIPGSKRRPGDIVTTAAMPTYRGALDVTVVSPEAGHAGEDPLESAYIRKFKSYAEEIPEMKAGGTDFRPLVLSSDGAPHLQVIRTLKYAADQAARKKGLSAGTRAGLVKRTMHEVTVQILRRRAAMYRECLPDYKERHHHYLYGKPKGARRIPTGGRNDGKARTLEVDVDESDEQWIQDRLAEAQPDLPDEESEEASGELEEVAQSLGYSWQIRER